MQALLLDRAVDATPCPKRHACAWPETFPSALDGFSIVDSILFFVLFLFFVFLFLSLITVTFPRPFLAFFVKPTRG